MNKLRLSLGVTILLIAQAVVQVLESLESLNLFDEPHLDVIVSRRGSCFAMT